MARKPFVLTAARCANLALLLGAIGWLLAIYGSLSQMGDPAPWVSKDELDAIHHRALSAILAGLACLMAALWLSGRGFAVAPWRSALVGLAVSIPMLGVLLAGLW